MSRYLMITEEGTFYSQYFDPKDPDNYDWTNLLVIDLNQDKFTKNGFDWFDIEEDHL